MDLEAILRLVNVVLMFATLSVAAYTDLNQKKVFNWTTYPAVGLGLALGYLTEGVGSFPSQQVAASGLLDRLTGFGLGFGLFYAFNRAHKDRAMGMGDVKLMGAIGALMGARLTVWAMFWGSLIGAVIALWALLGRGLLLRGVGRSFMAAIRIGREPTQDASATPASEGAEGAAVDGEVASAEQAQPERIRIPYAVALSFGAMLAWFLHSGSLG